MKGKLCRFFAVLLAFILAELSMVKAEILVELQPVAAEEGFSLEVVKMEKPRRNFRVYIYHTHTYEAYTMTEETQYNQTERWRTADGEYNMIRIGAELKKELEAAGVSVTHDQTAYEPPKLSSAYARSLEGLEKAREAGYDLYIDLHRDAYSMGNGPNTMERDGQKIARALFLIGQGASFEGEEKPDWEQNFQAAKWISDEMNGCLSGLSRGVSLKSGRYNQHGAEPCILIEAGNNENTLEEALLLMPYVAQGILSYFDHLELQEAQ